MSDSKQIELTMPDSKQIELTIPDDFMNKFHSSDY